MEGKGLDVYVVSKAFSWTMVFTHEGYIGPYFATSSFRVSNREDPLQVSGDIVNSRPSGTKPR